MPFIFPWQNRLLWINLALTGSQTNPAWVTPICNIANKGGCFREKQRKSPCCIKPDKLNWCHGSQSAALTIDITHFSLALTTSPGALITACPRPQSTTFETSQSLTLSAALPLDQTHLQLGSSVKKAQESSICPSSSSALGTAACQLRITKIKITFYSYFYHLG